MTSGNTQTYSVLMSVYKKEKAEYLRMAMDSIWQQTAPTDDFVLVCDGPLNEELDAVITDMQKAHPDTLHVVRLPENVGLGNALNEGIKHCRHELVARMDSDDISRTDRCERQLKVFAGHPELSICSGTVEEFVENTQKIESCRILPENNDEISAFAKKRNPFNHPCVMYRKADVESTGGYQDFFLLEDYYLWIRMLVNGAQGYNIQKPLLWMRAGSDLYKRRAGWKYAGSQRKLFKYMKEIGFINGSQYLKSVALRSGASLVPNRMREILFKAAVRKQA